MNRVKGGSRRRRHRQRYLAEFHPVSVAAVAVNLVLVPNAGIGVSYSG